MQLFLSVYVDEMKMARTIQKNMPKMWAILQKKIDLEDQVSFIDQVFLGCTQRATQVNNSIVVERQKLFSKLISTNADVKTEWKNLRDITAWSHDIEGHAQKCVECFGELAHNTVDQVHEASTTQCLDDHHIKPEDLEIVESCQRLALRTVKNACVWQESEDHIHVVQ